MAAQKVDLILALPVINPPRLRCLVRVLAALYTPFHLTPSCIEEVSHEKLSSYKEGRLSGCDDDQQLLSIERERVALPTSGLLGLYLALMLSTIMQSREHAKEDMVTW